MTNFERLQNLPLEEFADYIESVYLSGIFMEKCKNNPELKCLIDTSTEDYTKWLKLNIY